MRYIIQNTLLDLRIFISSEPSYHNEETKFKNTTCCCRGNHTDLYKAKFRRLFSTTHEFLKPVKVMGKKVEVKECIAVYGNPSHNYGVSLAVWDNTVLPATRHKRTHPAFTPAIQAGTRFTDHLRMEG